MRPSRVPPGDFLVVFRRPTPRRRLRAGLIVPLLALCLLDLAGVVAIAIDGGVLLDSRRQVQMAADASALAGAIDLFTNYAKNGGTDPAGTAAKSAKTTAAGNGFTDGGNATVTVNIPPKSGAFTGQAGYVEVIIQFSQRRYFSAIWGSGQLPVTCRAVARGLWKPPAFGILLLDPGTPGALTVSGSGDVVVSNGGTVVVNSSSNSGAAVSGNGNLVAAEFDLAGTPGYSVSGSGTLKGTVNGGQSATADPLASLPAPTPPVPTFAAVNYSDSTPLTLSPGTYAGGIHLSSQAPVTLLPGTYYLQGGGLSVSGGASLSGSGVVIYNAPNDSSDSISLTGSGSVTLSAPTSGTYQGIAIFQDRNASAPLSITGNSNLSLTGSIYAAGAKVTITGNGGVDGSNNPTDVIGSQLIAYDLTTTGNGGFQVAPDNNARKRRFVQLVE